MGSKQRDEEEGGLGQAPVAQREIKSRYQR